MNDYKIMILKKLITKYEHSNNVNRKISLKFDIKNMYDYVSEDSYKYVNLIESATLSLEKLNYIEVIRDKVGINKVILNKDMLDDIYKYLNIESKDMKKEKYLKLINYYQDKGELTSKFCNLIREKINNNKPYKSYFKDAIELKDILITLSSLEKQEVEISRRAFSAKYLNDSKKLEKIESHIVKIILELDDTLTDYNDDILSYFNVYKNPSFIYLRGSSIFKLKDNIIDLSKFNKELILTSRQLEDIEIVSLKESKVITIENLTSFYDYPLKSDILLIYLGGFHNKVKRDFLTKLKNIKGLEFYHAGDIDVGGFYILNHLRNKTNINFKPIKMDIKTLEEYHEFTISLTSMDIKRLKMISKELIEFKDIFDYMLENNVKLEQENIIYK